MTHSSGTSKSGRKDGASSFAPAGTSWSRCSLSAASGATLKVLEDQSALASGTNADNETYEITLQTTPRASNRRCGSRR